ncbi:MAG: DUF2712 domain-containing protein [Oscillospiraceae bacterium]
MKNMSIRKISVFFLTIIVFCISTLTAFAAEDKFEYNIDTKAYPYFGYTSSHYLRTTTRTNNPWKVDARMSTEGDGTIMMYEICYKNGALWPSSAEKLEAVACNSGSHYFKANKNAANKDTYLRVRNNNNTDKCYNVKGYWDEETGGTI